MFVRKSRNFGEQIKGQRLGPAAHGMSENNLPDLKPLVCLFVYRVVLVT